MAPQMTPDLDAVRLCSMVSQGTRPCRIDIDCGSTSTRAILSWWDKNGKLQDLVVENTGKVALFWLEDGQFPTLIYAFDTDTDGTKKLYDCTRSYRDRDAASAKYWFYYMAGFKDDKLLLEYSHVHAFRQHADDPAFCARFRRGLVELFIAVLTAAKAICDRKLLRITDIGLTIPGQWTLEFQEAYTVVVAEAYEEVFPGMIVPPDNFHFIYEVEALAHFCFNKLLDDMRPRSSLRTPMRHTAQKASKAFYDKMLFLDFGGHSMGGCQYHVVPGDDDKVSYYGDSDSFGVGGGSEQWAYEIATGFAAEHNIELTPEVRMQILENFHKIKDEMGPGKTEKPRPVLVKNRTTGALEIKPISQRVVDDAFEKAMFAPLRRAEKMILRLGATAERTGQRCLVVVTGGTSRHDVLRARLRAICRKANLLPPSFPRDLGHNLETTNLVRGSMYAGQYRKTVEQFLRSGAAFGLQMKQRDNNVKGLWDDSAYILMAHVKHTGGQVDKHIVELEVKQGDLLRLVCDPFWGSLRRDLSDAAAAADDDDVKMTGTTPTMLNLAFCYTVLELGRYVPPGHYTFSLSKAGQKGDNMRLKLSVEQRRNPEGESDMFVPQRLIKYRPLEFGLYYNAGSNTALAGEPNSDLQEQGLTNLSAVPEL